MRISELSHRSGLPVATVKYYLREGLLRPGRKESARLAEYDETHLDRLALLRVLREVGQIPVSRLKDVIAAVEDSGLTVHQVFGRAAHATAPAAVPPGPHHDRAASIGDALIAHAGWDNVEADAADRRSLTGVLEVILDLVPAAAVVDGLLPYLEAADAVGRHEIASLDAASDREHLLEAMVVGQVVFGQLLAVLRRLAEQHYSAERFSRARPAAERFTEQRPTS